MKYIDVLEIHMVKKYGGSICSNSRIYELIPTDSRVNNIGIWIENSSQIRVGEV